MNMITEAFKTDPIGVYVCIMAIIPLIAVTMLAVRHAWKKYVMKKAVERLWRMK